MDMGFLAVGVIAVVLALIASRAGVKRSTSDDVFGGVCGGLAQYWGISSAAVRILWVVFTLAGGCGLLFYLVFWLVLPER